mgnify:CR=1 FL=1
MCDNGNQRSEHLTINVVPRKENDSFNFQWKPSPAKPEDLKAVAGKINDETFYIGKVTDKPKGPVEEKKVQVISDKAPSEGVKPSEEEKPEKQKRNKNGESNIEEKVVNYMTHHLKKIP